MSIVTQTNISTSLREHRIKAGLSRAELAGLAKVSERTVRRIELGQVDEPNMATVRALAASLGVTPSDLIQVEVISK